MDENKPFIKDYDEFLEYYGPQLKFGSILEFRRYKKGKIIDYSHFGMYVGIMQPDLDRGTDREPTHCIAHLVYNYRGRYAYRIVTTLFFYMFTQGNVRIVEMKTEFDDNSGVRVNNLEKRVRELGLKRLTDHQIRKNLMIVRAKHPKYHFFKFNCEHMVTGLVYGKSVSVQVRFFDTFS